MALVAAIVANPKEPETRCLVFWTGKTGLMSVDTETYCKKIVDTGKGISQVPHQLITCVACKVAVEARTGLPFHEACK